MVLFTLMSLFFEVISFLGIPRGKNCLRSQPEFQKDTAWVTYYQNDPFFFSWNKTSTQREISSEIIKHSPVQTNTHVSLENVITSNFVHTWMRSFVQPRLQITPDNHDEVVLQETEADLEWCLSCDVWEQQMITVYTDDMETLCSNCQHGVCSFSSTRALGFSVISEIIQSPWKSREQCCQSVQKSGYLNPTRVITMNFRSHRHGLFQQHYTSSRAVHSYHTREQSENEFALIFATALLLFSSEHFNSCLIFQFTCPNGQVEILHKYQYS